MEMDIETIYWIIKISIALLSLVLLYRFKGEIVKVITDIIVGGDTKEYVGTDFSEIKERIKRRMEEVLG